MIPISIKQAIDKARSEHEYGLAAVINQAQLYQNVSPMILKS